MHRMMIYGNGCMSFFKIATKDPRHLPLEEVLIFFSGSDGVPPVGFDLPPTLTFDEESVFPTASTLC